ncbi:MAG TPA: hypothetical protein VGX23_23015 [Actinocrinis sp.]|nr:hypothetical protein [Actinocrinis sp.]
MRYSDLSEADHARALTDAGMPSSFAQIVADADQGVRRGVMHTDNGDLTRLLARPTTPLATAIAAALAASAEA